MKIPRPSSEGKACYMDLPRKGNYKWWKDGGATSKVELVPSTADEVSALSTKADRCGYKSSWPAGIAAT